MAVSHLPLLRPGLWVCSWLVLAPQLAVAQAPGKPPESAPAPAAKAAPAPSPVPAPGTAPTAAPAAPVAATPPTPAPSTSSELGEPVPPGMEEEPESLAWTLIRTLFVLGAVVASIYLTLNVGLRRLMGLQGVATGRPSLVSVVERVPLDQRRTLFVLKAADEYLLVGGGEQGLQLLSKLDTASVERLRAERPPTSAVPLTPFLQKLLSRRTGSQPPSA